MSEPVACSTCGAVSFNDPGKTKLHCHTCYKASLLREAALREVLTALTGADWSAVQNTGDGLEKDLPNSLVANGELGEEFINIKIGEHENDETNYSTTERTSRCA